MWKNIMRLTKIQMFVDYVQIDLKLPHHIILALLGST